MANESGPGVGELCNLHEKAGAVPQSAETDYLAEVLDAGPE